MNRSTVLTKPRDLLKEAVLGGDQESSFEQAFSQLGYTYIRDKAPRLLDFLVGFQLAGIKKMFPVLEGERFEERISSAMYDETVGILVVKDEDMQIFPPHRRKQILDSVRPVIISIGRTDIGDIRDKIRQAIGIDLYGN